MAGDPFARAHKRLFRRLGEEAFFRGATEPVRLLVERGVQQVGEYGPVDDYRHVCHIPVALAPQVDDAVRLAEGAFSVDRILDNDGYAVRCVLRPA